MNPETEFDCATAPRRNSKRWTQGTVTWREVLEWLEKPADHKECGNYMMGALSGPYRTNRSVLSRSMLTLDMDEPNPDFLDGFQLTWDNAAAVHSTWKSRPDEPRYRLLLPTDRDMDPEEYFACCNVIMDRLGREQFDPSTDEVARYMFRPSTSDPAYYESAVLDGEPLSVDELLRDWNPDLSQRKVPDPSRTKRDPFTLDGVVGAFNRTYEDFDLLIEKYDIPYESVASDRWHLVGSVSEAGVGLVAPGLVYSHHTMDPAWGVTCNAFDLVRLHRFAELDDGVSDSTPINRLPSHQAMIDLASEDKDAVSEMVGAAFTSVDDDDNPSDWRSNLSINARTGKMNDTIQNWDLIVNNDRAFTSLYFNEMSLAIEIDADLPWRSRERGGELFTSADRAAMYHYLEREYTFRPTRQLVDELIVVKAQENSRHPVREYLEGLKWDGTPRVETALPGVTPTRYTRMVARKCFAAAAARALDPGVKWDHTLVLYGAEGLGKSWWISKVARGFTDSLGPLRDKDTLLAMQRAWIMVADEGHSLRKADADMLKEFLTRTHDVFRMPYDRETQLHPRHGVIWSTTNDEVFLRRQEGNRRFLIVHCKDYVDFDEMTDEYIDQLWAEAVHMYRQGERLFLEGHDRLLAAHEREAYTEENATAGIIGAYLDAPFPDDWESRGLEQRLNWLQGRAMGLDTDGGSRLDAVCTLQVWVEALGNRMGEHRRTDLLEVGDALKHLGWIPMPKDKKRFGPYGSQQPWVRPEEDLL